MSKQSLREEIRHGVGRIIGLQLAFTLLLTLVLAFGLGYYIVSTDLKNKQQTIGARISGEISAISSSLEALASSPVIWTALTDTADRNAYLTPLLQSLNRTDTFRVGVLDYRGREFVMPDSFFLTREDYGQRIQKWLDMPQLHFEVIDKPGEGIHLLVMAPIESPMTQSIVGYVVSVYGVNRSLSQVELGGQSRIDLSFNRKTPVQTSSDWFELASTSRQTITTPTGDFIFYLTVTESYRDTLLVFGVALLFLALIGLYARRLGSRWAASFSARTVTRLESLLTLSRRIIRGEKVPLPAFAAQDEIGEIETTLGKLLTDQANTLNHLKTAASVFMTAGEAIMVTDQSGTIVDVNPALLEITGFEAAELIGQRSGKLYRSPDQPSGDDQIARSLDQEGIWRGETVFWDKRGQAIPAQLAVSRVHDAQGQEHGQVAVFTDIREIKRAEEQLRQLAYEDSLTGLANYRAFAEMIQKRIDGVDSQRKPFLLAFMDLDRLKQINDLYGHEKGDEVIVAAAEHLVKTLPSGHFLCRRSGDEFLALIEFQDGAHLDQIQRSLNKQLGHYTVALDSTSFRSALSTGITEFPRYATTLRVLLQQADAALFDAKRESATGKVAWYSERLGAKLNRSLAIEAALPKAIREGKIVAHFQPEVEIPSGRIIGFEALARWHDPELGRVSPDEFISIAEDANLIGPLTESVFSQVLTVLPQFQKKFQGVKVAVNVSPRLFVNRRMIELLTDKTDDIEDCLNSLVLEMTESDLSSQLNLLMSQLQLIRGLGVEIAIDDFGKGHSSLSRLVNMPLDKLKIDSSFVAGIGDPTRENIIDIIVALADTLHLSVTAEGVETAEQVQALVKAGCSRAQGWHFARAMPLDEVLALPPILNDQTKP